MSDDEDRRSRLATPVAAQSALRRDQSNWWFASSPSMRLAKIGAEKVGSSSRTERYSRPFCAIFFHAAPNSTAPVMMRKSGAFSLSFSVGMNFGPDVEGQCLDRADEASFALGERSDIRHDRLSVCCRARVIAASMAVLAPGGDRPAPEAGAQRRTANGRAILTCARSRVAAGKIGRPAVAGSDRGQRPFNSRRYRPSSEAQHLVTDLVQRTANCDGTSLSEPSDGAV
ncbi:hypothetical protein ACVWZK_001739 [Bradyrhizobium sp. GM0.4]